jgi:hypothetical protein
MELEQQELPFPEASEKPVLDDLARIQAELETMYEHLSPAESPCGCTGPTYHPVLQNVDLGGLARIVTALTGVLGAARDVKDLVEQHTIRVMPDRQAVVDGFVLERKSGTTRKDWDHTAVASKVAARACCNEDGEIVFGLEIGQRIADEILATAGIGYWRVSALRNRGIDPGQYCEETKGRPSLIVRSS